MYRRHLLLNSKNNQDAATQKNNIHAGPAVCRGISDIAEILTIAAQSGQQTGIFSRQIPTD
jgi:hypothetical protein